MAKCQWVRTEIKGLPNSLLRDIDWSISTTSFWYLFASIFNHLTFLHCYWICMYILEIVRYCNRVTAALCVCNAFDGSVYMSKMEYAFTIRSVVKRSFYS